MTIASPRPAVSHVDDESTPLDLAGLAVVDAIEVAERVIAPGISVIEARRALSDEVPDTDDEDDDFDDDDDDDDWDDDDDDEDDWDDDEEDD